jgi:hypothetical protein
LQQYNPQISWRTFQIDIKDDRGKSHTVLPITFRRTLDGENASETSWSQLNIISRAQAVRLIRKKKASATLWVLKNPSEEGTEKPQPSTAAVVLQHKEKGIQRILNKYKDVFRMELPTKLPPKREFEHEIETGDAKPVNVHAYPLSQRHMEEQQRQVEDLLKKGVIRTSSSPWGFPVLFVAKPGGEWRMCVDYRALNKVTTKNGYPLPRIQDLLDSIGQARVLSKIDLLSGYWQLRMGELSIPKTAFNTLFGKFEYVAMPMGLTNAPATFQTMMNKILQPFLNRFCFVYLDDILIFSKSLEEHERHLDEVLRTLQTHQLYAKPSKCKFAMDELEFCGHIVGNGQVKPIPAKLEVIRTWPRPKNVHEVRQFLGLAGYYRRFVKDFAKMAAPLQELLKEADAPEGKKKRKFRPVNWTASCETAFQSLKDALMSKPVLMQPNRMLEFIIETDASEWAVGSVLLQAGEDGMLHPVAFDGRKLTGAERNYPVHEKELLAIKEALRAWRCYIDNGTTTTIVTDHESLQYLADTKKYSKRLARWVAEFQEYSLTIKYRKGKEAIVPDAISRRPDYIGSGPANVAERILEIAAASARVEGVITETWAEAVRMQLAALKGQSEEKWVPAMIRYLRDGTPPTEKKLDKSVRSMAKDFRLRERIVMEDDVHRESEEQLVRVYDDAEAPFLEVPFRKDLVRKMHREFGHLGFPGLMGTIRSRAWWPTMREDIQEMIHSCANCQVSQSSKTSLERERAQHQVEVGIRPFERWGIDLIGPLPATPNKNKWIITAIDYATGWPVAKAVPEATEEAIARFLHEDIFINYGAPRELLSDNGPNLLAGAVQHYVKILQTRHRTTTPYHPRTNGKVENLNGLLGRILTKYLMGKPTRLWDEYLPQALFAARVRSHAVAGRSPFYLVYGVNPRIPSDENVPIDDESIAEAVPRIEQVNHARSIANELLLNRAIKTNKIRDSTVTKTSFEVGSWVLVRNEGPEKFQSRWFGPYRVLKSHPLGTYALEEPGGRVLRNLINGSRLIEAQVDDPKELWSSAAYNRALKRKGMTLERPIEVRKIVDAHEPDPITYSELSTITRAEWDERERAGAHRLVGEDEPIAERVLKRARQKASRRRAIESGIPRKRGRPARQKKDSDESASELAWSAHSSEEEPRTRTDASDTDDNADEDVRPQRSVQFDGPFAVIV